MQKCNLGFSELGFYGVQWSGPISVLWSSSFQNVSIGIVGKDMEFIIYDDNDVAPLPGGTGGEATEKGGV